MGATWPLSRLTISANGIRIEPTWRGLRFLLVPHLDLSWSEIENVQAAGTISSRALAIRFGGKSIYWGFPGQSTELVEAVEEVAPEKLKLGIRRILWI
jgi:hypothetical protein